MPQEAASMGSDAAYTGLIPELYTRYLGPLFFEPYAADVAQRVAAIPCARVLETAAGTGIVTRRLRAALPPDVSILATDLNGAMVEHGQRATTGPNIQWHVADAQALPFGECTFDAVVCQFGVMFFPDKELGYRETRRVLEPGGRFIFVIWDALPNNAFAAAAHDVAAELFPASVPEFFRRGPHGYHNVAEIEAALRRSGFADVRFEISEKRSCAPRARDVAIGLFEGTPIRAQIEERDPGALPRAVNALERLLRERYGDGAVEAPMRAHIVTAR